MRVRDDHAALVDDERRAAPGAAGPADADGQDAVLRVRVDRAHRAAGGRGRAGDDRQRRRLRRLVAAEQARAEHAGTEEDRREERADDDAQQQPAALERALVVVVVVVLVAGPVGPVAARSRWSAAAAAGRQPAWAQARACAPRFREGRSRGGRARGGVRAKGRWSCHEGREDSSMILKLGVPLRKTRVRASSAGAAAIFSRRVRSSTGTTTRQARFAPRSTTDVRRRQHERVHIRDKIATGDDQRGGEAARAGRR